MSKLLTTRKTAWVKQFKPEIVAGTPLNYNAAIADRYAKRLDVLIDRMTAETERRLIALLTDTQYGVGMDASTPNEAAILLDALTKKFENLFGDASETLARSMTDEAMNSSEASLKTSLKQLSGGLTLKTNILTGDLKEVVQATIKENVLLIKTIPRRYLTQVQGAVMRSITTGNGLQDLVPFFKNQRGITKRSAKLIALDQTRKAYAGINKHRMQAVGIKQFKWLHSGGGQHPRKLHLEVLDGQIFSFDKLPIIDERTKERGIPGQAINCRCRMMPVINFGVDE